MIFKLLRGVLMDSRLTHETVFSSISTLLTGNNRCVYYRYMAKTVINIKVDKEVKEGARALADALGLPLSTIVNANLREFIRSGQVTFSLEPKLKPEVWKKIQKAVEDYRASRNVSPVLTTAREIAAHLNS